MIRSRFAPSPTGKIHLGNARTAIFAWLLARSDPDGQFILRIEDTDRERSKKEYEDAIIEDLRWLGLDFDEGPAEGGPFAPYRQSERLPRYLEAVDRMIAAGQAYRCFCSQEELDEERRASVARRLPPRYSGRCRDLSAADVRQLLAEGRPYAVRFRIPEKDVPVKDLLHKEILYRRRDLEDFIIRRSDGTVSFLLASVMDDSDMNVTHVIRGDDHLSNTPKQLLLLDALGKRAPVYAHLGLILGTDGKPLSKREGSSSIEEMRALGYQSSALFKCLCRLGWNPPEISGENPYKFFSEKFRIEDVSGSPCVWDRTRLDHENVKAVRSLPVEEIYRAVESQLPHDEPKEILFKALEALRPEIKHLSDIPRMIDPLLPREIEFDETAKSCVRTEEAHALYIQALALLHDPALVVDWVTFSSALKETSGLSGKRFFHPMRAAMNGRLSGIELARLYEILGPEIIKSRIEKALKQ